MSSKLRGCWGFFFLSAVQEERGPRKNKGTKRASILARRSAQHALPAPPFGTAPPVSMATRVTPYESSVTSLEPGLAWSPVFSAFRRVTPRGPTLHPYHPIHPLLAWPLPASLPAILFGSVTGAADCLSAGTTLVSRLHRLLVYFHLSTALVNKIRKTALLNLQTVRDDSSFVSHLSYRNNFT